MPVACNRGAHSDGTEPSDVLPGSSRPSRTPSAALVATGAVAPPRGSELTSPPPSIAQKITIDGAYGDVKFKNNLSITEMLLGTNHP